MTDKLTIEIFAGCGRATFSPGSEVGPLNSQTSPGIGFEFESDYIAPTRNGKLHVGRGVISRRDAARLRDMLEIFLKDCTRRGFSND